MSKLRQKRRKEQAKWRRMAQDRREEAARERGAYPMDTAAWLLEAIEHSEEFSAFGSPKLDNSSPPDFVDANGVFRPGFYEVIYRGFMVLCCPDGTVWAGVDELTSHFDNLDESRVVIDAFYRGLPRLVEGSCMAGVDVELID